MKNLPTEKLYAPIGRMAIVLAVALTICVGWLLGMSPVFPLSPDVFPVCPDDGSQCGGYAGPHTPVGFFGWGMVVWAVIGVAAVVLRYFYLFARVLGAELVTRVAMFRHKGGATR